MYSIQSVHLQPELEWLLLNGMNDYTFFFSDNLIRSLQKMNAVSVVILK